MLENFKDWFARPFAADQSVTGWFLFLGLLIVITIIWGMILRTLEVA